MITGIDKDRLAWNDARRRLVVASLYGDVIGIACVEHCGWVNVFVKLNVRRKGYGTLLFKEAANVARTIWNVQAYGRAYDRDSGRFFEHLGAFRPENMLDFTG